MGLDLLYRRRQAAGAKARRVLHQDLLDMEVFNEAGRSIGRITEVITTGANDVYQVDRPGW